MNRPARLLALAGILVLSAPSAGSAAEAPTVRAWTTGVQPVAGTLLEGAWNVRDGGRRARLLVQGRSDSGTASRYRAHWLSGWVPPGRSGSVVAVVEECTSHYGAVQAALRHVVRFRVQSVRGAWSPWTELRSGYPERDRPLLEPGYRGTRSSGTFAGGRGPLRVEVQVLGTVNERFEDVLFGVAVDVLPATGTVHGGQCDLPRE